MNIKQLNDQRCRLADRVRQLGMMGTPVDYKDRMRSDAQYQLAKDAWMKAETEYQRAISTLSTKELMDTLSEF